MKLIILNCGYLINNHSASLIGYVDILGYSTKSEQPTTHLTHDRLGIECLQLLTHSRYHFFKSKSTEICSDKSHICPIWG